MKAEMVLTTEDGRYSVETDVENDGCLPNLIEDVIEPLLLAAGYHPTAISKCFASGESLEPADLKQG